MLVLKLEQEAGSRGRLPSGKICRSAVNDGSKRGLDGVIRAFRFCVIESSIVPRDSRRKSALEGVRLAECFEGGRRVTTEQRSLPRNAVSLKQNWGVRPGLVDGCGCGIAVFAGAFTNSCRRAQKNPATLLLILRLMTHDRYRVLVPHAMVGGPDSKEISVESEFIYCSCEEF